VIERTDLPAPSWTGPGPSGGTAIAVSPLGEGLVTAEVVAAHLAVDVSTIYRLAASGALPVVVIGRAKRFRVADVRAFIELQTRGCTAPRGTSGAGVDRVQQLLAGTRHGASRRPRPARSNDLDVSAPQSVHPTPKQEPWRPPGLAKPEEHR
jgi:excisionase family DNA binding protein